MEGKDKTNGTFKPQGWGFEETLPGSVGKWEGETEWYHWYKQPPQDRDKHNEKGNFVRPITLLIFVRFAQDSIAKMQK